MPILIARYVCSNILYLNNLLNNPIKFDLAICSRHRSPTDIVLPLPAHNSPRFLRFFSTIGEK